MIIEITRETLESKNHQRKDRVENMHLEISGLLKI